MRLSWQPSTEPSQVTFSWTEASPVQQASVGSAPFQGLAGPILLPLS